MSKGTLVSTLAVLACLTGCASVSSSSAPAISQENWTTDPVYVTTSTVPTNIGYEVVGHVKANARTGYDSVETLYPLLVQEARKVGANAVVGVKGGRSPSAFSWAAPFTSGTAIRIDNVEKLEKYDGKYY
ncbi:hypothetical protein ACT3R7_17650 [Halomonas sp. AOP43-A1-21]